MQFFQRDSYCFSRLHVLHTTRHFFIPGSLNRPLNIFETLRQSVGQASTLVNRESQCPL